MAAVLLGDGVIVTNATQETIALAIRRWCIERWSTHNAVYDGDETNDGLFDGYLNSRDIAQAIIKVIYRESRPLEHADDIDLGEIP